MFKKFPNIENSYNIKNLDRWKTFFPELTNEKFGVYNVIKEQKYQYLIWYLSNMSEKHDINLYGELFGQGIQNKINYGKNKQILFFAMYLDGKWLSYKKLKEFFISINCENLLSPKIGSLITFEEIKFYNPRFNSVILGIENNICEGVVIIPYENEYEMLRGSRFAIKIKNDEFLEKAKRKNRVNIYSNKVKKLNEEFKSYITDIRLQGIYSKE